jgi:hypothetical protein
VRTQLLVHRGEPMFDTGDLLGLEKSICGCVQDTNGQVLVQRPQRVLKWHSNPGLSY